MTSPADIPGPDLDFRAGWVALPRALRNHPVMRKGAALALFIYILTRVRYKAGLVDLANGSVTLQAGQCAYGQREVADAIGLGRQALRGAEAYLERHRLIARKTTQAGTVITVRDFERYRPTPVDEQPAGDPPPTRGRPTSNPDSAQQQPLSRREDGEEREDGIHAKTGEHPPIPPRGNEAGARSQKRTRRAKRPPATAGELAAVDAVLRALSEASFTTWSLRKPNGQLSSGAVAVLDRVREGYPVDALIAVAKDRVKSFRSKASDGGYDWMKPGTIFGRNFDEYFAQAGWYVPAPGEAA